MKAFVHRNAGSLEEASALLMEFGDRARLNAGGSDLLAVLKDEIHPTYPEVVVNLKSILGLDSIEEDDGGVRIGALTKVASIAALPTIGDRYAVLVEAARSVATPQIRAVGTLGGNLCQEVRCWYYRYPRHVGGSILCFRKGARGCPAIKGDNRYHAVLGGRGCHAVCPSDLATALTVLDATVGIVGPAGRRQLPVAELYSPRALALERGELVSEVRIARPPEGARQTFAKFTGGRPGDFAIMSVAAVVTSDGNVCTGARIALGAVAPYPVRVAEAEACLVGKTIDGAAVAAAAAAAVDAAKPMSRNAYKLDIARTLVARTVLSLARH